MHRPLSKWLQRWLADSRSAIVLFGGRCHQVRRKLRRYKHFRKFRRSSLYTWMAAHLLLIILINCISAYKAYHEFYHTPGNAAVVQKLTPLVEAVAIRYYGRYTGAETGYGFFGINVRSNGMLIGECGGTPMTADFKSYETTLRFFSMANALTDDFIKPDAHDSLPGGLLGEYNNLVFKNIAVTMYQQHGCVDSTVLLSYNVLQFPTLQAVRTGTPPAYQLTKLVTGTYSLTPHAQ